MSKILNINALYQKVMAAPGFAEAMTTEQVGDATGSEKIYVNIDYVKPGGKNAKYHTHSLQEEFFIILSGSGILRMNGEEIKVAQGDAIAKPAGQDIAHQFINDGDDILQILDIGTREKEDVAFYPDEDIFLLRSKRLAFNKNGALENWSSDPNGD